MDKILEFLKSAGGIATSISAIIALVTTIVVLCKKHSAKVKAEKAKEDEFKQEMRTSMGAINTRIQSIENSQDANEKDHIRSTMFRFAAECRRGEKHTLDEFHHVLALKDKYDVLLAKTGDTNGVFTAEYNYILRVYEERQQNNDFIL